VTGADCGRRQAAARPLQRIWRDLAVAARQTAISPTVSYEVYGKALLCVGNRVTPLV
jgi:hypothetical protein